MPRKQTDIQELQGHERELRTKIAADLEALLRCQESLLVAFKEFEADYSRKGDRYPITRYISSMRQAHEAIRVSLASVSQLRVPSYKGLMDTLRDHEGHEKARQERKAARKTSTEKKVTHAP